MYFRICLFFSPPISSFMFLTVCHYILIHGSFSVPNSRDSRFAERRLGCPSGRAGECGARLNRGRTWTRTKRRSSDRGADLPSLTQMSRNKDFTGRVGPCTFFESFANYLFSYFLFITYLVVRRSGCVFVRVFVYFNLTRLNFSKSYSFTYIYL